MQPLWAWCAQQLPRPRGPGGGLLRALWPSEGSKFSCMTVGLGLKKLVAHLSGSSAERLHCLGTIETVPGRLGHKAPGSANRSWGGNFEPARCTCFHSTSRFTRDTHSPAFMKTHSAYIHTHTKAHPHTLKPCTHSQVHSNHRAFHTSQDTSSHAIHMWPHTQIYSNMHTLVHRQTPDAPRVKAKGSSVHFPAFISLLTCVFT